jgi:rhodanese-related sulfurtransferase
LAILSGCSTSEAEDLSPQNSVIDVVIDVRTPMEYADGHVEGSLNLDVESGTFESSLESLDKELTYLVYCRSGRRSAIAANLMRERGFEVFDAGSLQNMTDLGWSIGQ